MEKRKLLEAPTWEGSWTGKWRKCLGRVKVGFLRREGDFYVALEGTEG